MDAQFQIQKLPQRLKKAGLLCLMLVVGAPILGQAAQVTPKRGLDSQQHEKVKNIGQAILQSKRHYKPNDLQGQQLRTRVTEIRALLNNLTAVNDATPLTITQIQQPGVVTTAATSSSNAAAAQASWDKRHRADIDSVRQILGSLSTQCRTLRGQRSKAANPGLFQSITSFFSSSPVPQKPQVVTPVSNVALDRLEKLETEITDALKLPMATRQARLVALRESLQFNSVGHTTPSEQKSETPTFVSRTQHRRFSK